MWLLYSLSSLFASLSCIFFAILSYVNNPKSELNLRFSIISFVVGGWAFFPYITSMFPNPEDSLFYGRIFYIFAIFTPPTFFNFVFVTLNVDRKKFNKLIYYSYIVSVIFLFFSFSDLFIKGVVTRAPNSYVIPGPLYIVYIFFFGALCLRSIILLFKKYKKLNGYEREQIKFLTLAFFVALIGGGMHLMSAYINIEIIPHDLLIFAWSMIVFYSISKYGYLNIKRTLIRSIAFIVVYCCVLGVPFYIGFKTNQWFIASIILFGLSTVGPLFLRYLHGKAEKLLIAKEEKYQKFLLNSSMLMTEQKELQKLTQLIVNAIIYVVKIKSISLFVYDEEKQLYYCIETGREKNKDMIFKEESPLITYIKSNSSPFIIFNIPQEIKKIFSDISENATLVVPAFMRKKLIAFLVLGEKSDNSLYSIRDLDVFKLLSNNVALAITNCNFLSKTYNQQQKLFEAEKLAYIGGMADGIVHQIRNRLNNFGFAAELLKSNIEDFSTFHNNFVEKNSDVSEMIKNSNELIGSIKENIQKTNTILTGILNFAKPKGFITDKEMFSFKDIIEPSVTLIKIKHHKEKIPIAFDVPQEDKIYGIKYQIQEICFNCIDNAFEAIMEKEQYIKKSLADNIEQNVKFVPEIKISLKYLTEQSKYQIIIKDNGIGIKQENKNKIFSAFFTTKTSSKSGSGIGAYIVKRMVVDAHNGNISFESKYGEGTSFVITLPLS